VPKAISAEDLAELLDRFSTPSAELRAGSAEDDDSAELLPELDEGLDSSWLSPLRMTLLLELDSGVVSSELLISMLEETGSSTGLEDASSPQATRNAVKARAKNPKCLIFYSFTHP
jgi:hypothetical protein